MCDIRILLISDKKVILHTLGCCMVGFRYSKHPYKNWRNNFRCYLTTAQNILLTYLEYVVICRMHKFFNFYLEK